MLFKSIIYRFSCICINHSLRDIKYNVKCDYLWWGHMGGSGEEFYLLLYTVLHRWRFYSEYVIFSRYRTHLIFGTSLGEGRKFYVGGLGTGVRLEEARWGKGHLWPPKKGPLTSCLLRNAVPPSTFGQPRGAHSRSQFPFFLFLFSHLLGCSAVGGPW